MAHPLCSGEGPRTIICVGLPSSAILAICIFQPTVTLPFSASRKTPIVSIASGLRVCFPDEIFACDSSVFVEALFQHRSRLQGLKGYEPVFCCESYALQRTSRHPERRELILNWFGPYGGADFELIGYCRRGRAANERIEEFLVVLRQFSAGRKR
jgi:hypothetical protein